MIVVERPGAARQPLHDRRSAAQIPQASCRTGFLKGNRMFQMLRNTCPRLVKQASGARLSHEPFFAPFSEIPSRFETREPRARLNLLKLNTVVAQRVRLVTQ